MDNKIKIDVSGKNVVELNEIQILLLKEGFKWYSTSHLKMYFAETSKQNIWIFAEKGVGLICTIGMKPDLLEKYDEYTEYVFDQSPEDYGLAKVYRKLKETNFKYKDWMGECPRRGSPWGIDEDNELMRELSEGKTVGEIASNHGRDIGGVRSRIDKIEEDRAEKISKTEAEANKLKMLADKLIKQGYRRTSNKFKTISRIDNSKWIEELAKQMSLAPADFYDINGVISSNWADYYRRSCSKDDKVVAEELFKLIPGSSGDHIGYCEK